jgi:hypothetical protein
MRIKDMYEDNGALFYTVELENDVFIDVKYVGNLCYVMDCEDGCKVYNSDGNTFDYHFNENEVVEFVKNANK